MDAGALTGAAFDGELAADFGDALAHVPQTIRSAERGGFGEAFAVVLDDDGGGFFSGDDLKANFRGAGMPDDVVKRFFDDEK